MRKSSILLTALLLIGGAFGIARSQEMPSVREFKELLVNFGMTMYHRDLLRAYETGNIAPWYYKYGKFMNALETGNPKVTDEGVEEDARKFRELPRRYIDSIIESEPACRGRDSLDLVGTFSQLDVLVDEANRVFFIRADMKSGVPRRDGEHCLVYFVGRNSDGWYIQQIDKEGETVFPSNPEDVARAQTQQKSPEAVLESTYGPEMTNGTSQVQQYQNKITPMGYPVRYQDLEYIIVESGVLQTNDYELYMAAFPKRRNPRSPDYISRQRWIEDHGDNRVDLPVWLLGLRSLQGPQSVDFPNATSLCTGNGPPFDSRATFEGLGIQGTQAWWLIHGYNAPTRVPIGTTEYTFRWCTAPGASNGVYLVNLGGSNGSCPYSIEIGGLYERQGRELVPTRVLDLGDMR